MSHHEGHQDDDTVGAAIGTPEQTDASSRAPSSVGHEISDLHVLLAIAGYRNRGLSDGRLEALGFVLEAGDPLEDQANRLIEDMAQEIATTITFEIAVGTGHPGRRLRLECEVGMLEASEFGRFPDAEGFTIRRVLYGQPAVDSAWVELTGEAREVAEAFARRVVPELERKGGESCRHAA